MNLTKQVGLVVGAAALTLTSGSFADTTPEANTDLKAKLDSALARIDQLEAKQNDNWLTEQRASEIRGLIGDVLADADTRASLLAQGMTAGYSDGALIQSADGNWSLKTNLHMQQRLVYNNQNTGSGTPPDTDRMGFENTRTKFILSGNVVSPDWFYTVEINVGSSGGTVNDDEDRTGTGDAYLGYDFGNGWTMRGGTLKAPFLREESVDSRYQLAVERSLVNYLFTAGRTDGISTRYSADNWRIAFGLNDGINTGQEPWADIAAEIAITARGEWLAMGNWDQFDDFTSPPGSESGLLVGAAFHWESNEDDALAAPANLSADTLMFTLDGSYEAGGWNVYAAFLYKSIESASPTVGDSDRIGLLMQGGYYFTDDWEGFVRYEWADLDLPTGFVGNADDISILTFGVNRYFDGHNAKWTTDFGFAVDGIDSRAISDSADGDITGFRADPLNSDGQFVLRSQVQIVF